MARLDLAADFQRVDQFPVWNGDPSLATNSDGEVGISLARGGGTKLDRSLAVGILRDFVVWFGDASDETVLRKKVNADRSEAKDGAGKPFADNTRFGAYLHVRLAQPDTRWFGAFGYAVKEDAAVNAPEAGNFVDCDVAFGRQVAPPSPIR
ncbi:MAG: hypothetical protein AB9M60_04435 [Leptothrix sp. (in: b-proteobacteria)]